jgi:hypothetical protein
VTDSERIDWSLTSWEGSRRAQLEQAASLSLDAILQAQEEMAQLSAELNPLASPGVGSAAASPTRVPERALAYERARGGLEEIPPSDAPPGYRTQAEDTSYEVERLLIERWRAMSSWQKAELLRAESRMLDTLALIGVRKRYPSADDREQRLRLAALRLGRDLVVQYLGWDPEREGW